MDIKLLTIVGLLAIAELHRCSFVSASDGPTERLPSPPIRIRPRLESSTDAFVLRKLLESTAPLVSTSLVAAAQLLSAAGQGAAIAREQPTEEIANLRKVLDSTASMLLTSLRAAARTILSSDSSGTLVTQVIEASRMARNTAAARQLQAIIAAQALLPRARPEETAANLRKVLESTASLVSTSLVAAARLTSAAGQGAAKARQEPTEIANLRKVLDSTATKLLTSLVAAARLTSAANLRKVLDSTAMKLLTASLLTATAMARH